MPDPFTEYRTEQCRHLLAPLQAIPDPQERLTCLLARTIRTPTLPPPLRTEDRRVPGCISRVWLSCNIHPDHTLQLALAAEAPMVGALAGLLCDLYHGQPVDPLRTASPFDPVTALGLQHWVTPTRIEGLQALELHIRATLQTASPEGSCDAD